MKLQFELTEDFKNELKQLLREVINEELNNVSLDVQPVVEDKELLSRKEASKFLGCSLTSLYNYQKNRLIPYHQVGRKILFSKSDLLNHLKISAN
ncbi:helix-turn-helix domain-containing protein [Carboxylicivirga sp. RSCT41]|uniref:helix-turn-helix domain-containing protein n=1 Tax=Carboxylicivirga agarovorans TaxID=3417570 RepID=UPI003D33378E